MLGGFIYYFHLIYSWLWPPKIDKKLKFIHAKRVREFKMLPRTKLHPKIVVFEPPSEIDEGSEESGWDGGDESSSSDVSLSHYAPNTPILPNCPKSPHFVPLPRKLSKMKSNCPRRITKI